MAMGGKRPIFGTPFKAKVALAAAVGRPSDGGVDRLVGRSVEAIEESHGRQQQRVDPSKRTVHAARPPNESTDRP